MRRSCGSRSSRGGREPTLFLVAVPPVVDALHACLHSRVDRFEQVRRLQADPQLREDAQPMQGQRLLEAFVETRRRRGIEEPQFLTHRLHGLERPVVGRVLTRRLELAPNRRPVRLGQIAHDVLALVPLTAGKHRRGPEYLGDRRVEPLDAIRDDQQALLRSEPALHQAAEKGCADAPVLRRRLHKAESPLAGKIISKSSAPVTSGLNIPDPTGETASRYTGVRLPVCRRGTRRHRPVTRRAPSSPTWRSSTRLARGEGNR